MNQAFRHTSRCTGAGALVLGALLLATGCATATRVPLHETNAQRLRTVRPVVALAQQELKVSIVVSTAGAGFGLVGALIDASANNNTAKLAEQKVIPVRNALVGWEAGGVLRAALEREVKPVAVLHAGNIEVRQVPDAKDAVAALLEGTKEDALFLVQADYRLSPTFDRIVVTTKASLLPAKLPPTEAEQAAAAEAVAAEDNAPAPRKPLYVNTFVASSALSGFVAGKTTMDEAAAMWAAAGGRAARAALDGAINELARMIAFDVVQAGPAGATSASATYDAPPEAPKLSSIGPYAQGALSGFAVRQEKGRAWIRITSGELAAVDSL